MGAPALERDGGAWRAPRSRPQLRLAATGPAGQRVLVVDFADPGGRRWTAIGGGDTLEEAIAFARESSPAGADWRPTGWRHLHGA